MKIKILKFICLYFIVILNAKGNIEFVYNVQNPNYCQGVFSGSIIVTYIDGGFPNYTYTLNKNNTFFLSNDNGIFENLEAGSYDLSITDGTLTSTSPIINLTLTTQISFSHIVTQPTCFGSYGKLEVTNISGGSKNYFVLINEEISSKISFLKPGSYTLKIKDNVGCLSNVVNFDITEPAKLNITNADITISNTICPTGKGYVILKNIANSVGLSFANINNSNYNLNDTIRLLKGRYNIQGVDSRNCTSNILDIKVEGPDQYTFAYKIENQFLCSSSSNGKIIFEAIAGGTNINNIFREIYSVYGLNSYKLSTNEFTNLSTGLYNLFLTEKIGNETCSSTVKSVEIYEYSKINATLKIYSPNCDNSSNGEIQVDNISGGYANPNNSFKISYYYTLKNVATNKIITQTSKIFSSILDNTTYKFQAIDELGCTSDEIDIIIPDIPQLKIDMINTQVVNASCEISDQPNGNITLTLNNIFLGNQYPPKNMANLYYYSIDGGKNYSKNSGLNITNLKPNTYNVIVKDNNNCLSNYENISVNFVNNKIDAKILEVLDITCYGKNDGSIVYSLPFITGSNYKLYINNVLTNQFNTGTKGVHTVQFKDQNSPFCSSELFQIEIKEPIDIIFSIDSIKDKLCYGKNNGKVTFKVENGVSPYKYELINNDTKETFNKYLHENTKYNLNKGNYTSTLTDANNCTKTLDFKINEYTDLTFTNDKYDRKCYFYDTSSIILYPTGGSTSSNNYFYSINNGNYIKYEKDKKINIFNNFINIKIKDEFGCESSNQVELSFNQPEILIFNYVKTDPTCSGKDNGTIELYTNINSVNNYLYSIDSGVSYSTNNLFQNLFAGNYNLQIKDQNDCTAEFKNVILNYKFSKIQYQEYHFFDPCVKDVGYINFSDVTNCSGNCYYSIDGGISYQENPNFTNLGNNEYNLIVKDESGCSTNPISFKIKEEFNYDIIFDTITCNYQADASIEIIPYGGQKPYTIKWNNVQNSSNFKIENLGPGNYTATLKDNNNCSLNIKHYISENSRSLVQANFELDNYKISVFNPVAKFYNTSKNAKNFLWRIGNVLNTDENPGEITLPFDVGVNKIYLEAQDEFGCWDTKVREVEIVDNLSTLRTSLAFTPNKDLINDYFDPLFQIGSIVNFCKMKIYNNQGDLLINIDKCVWDGKVNDNLTPSGIYFYTLDAHLKTGITKNYKGYVQLIN